MTSFQSLKTQPSLQSSSTYKLTGGFKLCVSSLTGTAVATGSAGIPQGGLVTMTLVLTSVGLPLESVSLVFAVDFILYEHLFLLLSFFIFVLVAEANLRTSESAWCLRAGTAPGPSPTCWPTASAWVWCSTCAGTRFRRPLPQRNVPLSF